MKMFNKYCLKLVTLSFCVWANQCCGQQWYPSTVPFNKNVNAAFIFNRNSVILAGGDTAYSTHDIFKSKDLGASWNIQIDQYQSWIKSISFHDTSTGYAVGDNGLVLKTTNGGNGWAYTNFPGNFTLNKIWCAGDSTIFVFGGNTNIERVIFKSVDAGNTWMLVDSAPGACLRSAFFINAQKGFAVGDSAIILMTTDSGNTWARITAPVARNFSSITFINPDTGFIVGGNAADSIRTILESTNAGLSWTVIKDESGNCLTDISFADGQNGFTVGDRASIFKSVNGGQTWVSSSVNGSTNADYFNCIKYLDPNFAVIGANSGNAFVYTNSPQPQVGTVYGEYYDSATYFVHSSINTHGVPVICRVDYSYDTSFTPAYFTYNQYVTSDTFANIGIFLYNLTPDTTYYYRFVVTSILGTSYVDTLSFFTGTIHYAFSTEAATSITDSSAQFNGAIQTFQLPVNLFFDYDTLPTFNHHVPALPALVSDTSYHLVSAAIVGLLPDKTYYYRLRGVTDSGAYYFGEIVTFHTVSALPYSSFVTLAATNVTTSTATLNGFIWRPTLPDTLSFEYGLSAAFGNLVVAAPLVVSDSIQHFLSAELTGLQAGVTYYYRIKAVTDTGAYYGDTRLFYTGTLFDTIATLPATVADTFVSLRGLIQGFRLPVTVSFDYGTTLAMSEQTGAFTYSDTGFYNIWGGPVGPLRNTLYYYRLKGETSMGTFYGNTLTFYISYGANGFQTLSASAVSANSAQLNGTSGTLLFPTNLSFEYGTTGALDSTIAAIPVSISDSLQHPISVVVQGLIPNTVYYYRLKGSVSAGVNFYGDIKQLYTDYCEIPNCGFELWDTSFVEDPTGWLVGGEVHRVPSYNGTSAVEFKGGSAGKAGGIVLGRFNGGLFGGVPFAARPDSILFFARYNIAVGDTAIAIVSFTLHGAVINQQLFPITGSSGGSFVLTKFKITFPDSNVPDSLAVGFASSNVNSQNQNPNSILAIDDISFAGTNLTVPNANFESWNNYTQDVPDQWNTNTDEFVTTNIFDPLVKTSDKVSGNYALLLQNNPTLSGRNTFIKTGKSISYFKPTFPVGARHVTFNGYVKFLPENNDTLIVSVTMYLHGANIGGQTLSIDTPIVSYAPFSANISYNNPNGTDIPDSADITILLGNNFPRGNSLAYFDNLSFDGFTTDIQPPPFQPLNEMVCNIYPNPAEDNITVIVTGATGTLSYSIRDIVGHKLLNSTINTASSGNTIKNLDVSCLPTGTYLLQIQSQTASTVQKFIIDK